MGSARGWARMGSPARPKNLLPGRHLCPVLEVCRSKSRPADQSDGHQNSASGGGPGAFRDSERALSDAPDFEGGDEATCGGDLGGAGGCRRSKTCQVCWPEWETKEPTRVPTSSGSSIIGPIWRNTRAVFTVGAFAGPSRKSRTRRHPTYTFFPAPSASTLTYARSTNARGSSTSKGTEKSVVSKLSVKGNSISLRAMRACSCRL